MSNEILKLQKEYRIKARDNNPETIKSTEGTKFDLCGRQSKKWKYHTPHERCKSPAKERQEVPGTQGAPRPIRVKDDSDRGFCRGNYPDGRGRAQVDVARDTTYS